MTVGAPPSQWRFFRFYLIVTGVGERSFLPKFFRPLLACGQCHVEVIRQVGQRSPITSPKRKLKMVGMGQTITSKDAAEIGLTARRYLQSRDDCYVLLIDDLEVRR